jgi:hypothetical protein
MKSLIGSLVLLFATSLIAQEREEFFHGSAILTRVDQTWDVDHWNTVRTPISGAVTVTRADHDYGVNGWCPEHWSMQFTPSSGIDLIRDLEISASPDATSEDWAMAWVVAWVEDRHAYGFQEPGGNLYVISDSHGKMELLITPSDPAVRAILNPAFSKYQSATYFMYGFQMRRIADYMQIDLRNRCTEPATPAGRGASMRRD